jgi:ATP-dependent DNA helicase PIF1
MKLSPDQEEAFNAFKERKNILLTGPGGSGKTALIKRMVEFGLAENKEIQVCALTGCAAVLLRCGGAKTIHSWAGVGLASGPSGKVIERVVKSKYKRTNWNKVDVLIIDEISMMSKKLFEILDTIARKIKKKPHVPFGGIQVVFSGDFYQLPPVGNREEIETMQFCFESDRWSETIHQVVQLTTIFRQTDLDYTKILNQIRVGKLTKSSYEKLMKRVNITAQDNNDICIKPTILLPRRKDVDFINASELMKLETEATKYEMAPFKEAPTSENERKKLFGISPEDIENETNFLMGNVMADKTLSLRVGAQIMCVANLDMEGPYPIVNGSQGIIVDICDGLPMVQFTDGQKRIIGWHIWQSETIPGIGIKQIPLIHAWAITIHKAQGVTLELAEIDAGSNIFECGQSYVALSRLKGLDGLFLTAFDPQKIKVNKKVQEYYKKLS